MYAPMIAHSIHSLTLEDIRYFFEEDATEENGIPTGKKLYLLLSFKNTAGNVFDVLTRNTVS